MMATADAPLRDHLVSVTQIPDYVLGTLDDTSLRRMERHLQRCDTCRNEYLFAMEALIHLGSHVAPPPAARAAILERVSAETTLPVIRPRPRHMPAEVLPDAAPWRSWPRPRDLRRVLPPAGPVSRGLVAAAAALLLAMGAVGWLEEQRRPSLAEAQIEALVNDPSVAYSLVDSDLPITATGVVFADPGGRQAVLLANDLPLLPHDQRYQVWLFTIDNERVSAGMLSPGPDGAVMELLQMPDAFASYVGIALTVEPEDGSAAPTTDMVLGGSLPPPSEEPPVWQDDPGPPI